MTLTEKILQLKQDIDLVYQAGLTDSGGPAPKRVILTGNGYESLDLAVEDNTIYSISHYANIHITPPYGTYQAYLYINLPNVASVSVTFAPTLPVSGNNITEAKPGQVWEISMDSVLGALLLDASKFMI